MQALTLTQPWATLVAAGHKRIETRSWKPLPREVGDLIIIHAGKGLNPLREMGFPGTERGLRMLCETEPFRTALEEAGYGSQVHYGLVDRVPIAADRLPRGALVAVARLAKVVPAPAAAEKIVEWGRSGGLLERERANRELAFGGYGDGRWAWILRDIQPLKPIRCTGAQKLWPVPVDLVPESLR